MIPLHHASRLLGAAALLAAAACATTPTTTGSSTAGSMSASPPSPDPRVGLRAGRYNAGEAAWNLRLVSTTPSPEPFSGSTNSDLAFTGKYAIQGNYHGFQVWDISNPAKPVLAKAYVCPASQSDVSVYRNLLFVSGEGQGGRLDCGTQGVRDTVSKDRLRGIRIFDITDITNPKYVGNVQTCRGSHTHTVLEHPGDRDNVYVYVSGSANIRSPSELPGCIDEAPEKNPNSALFRIEVIKVPLANPAAAAIASSPRIFNNLAPPPEHGEAPDDVARIRQQVAAAKARGDFTATFRGLERALNPGFTRRLLDSLVTVRGGSGAPTAADSAKLRTELQGIINRLLSSQQTGPDQCHDITVFPAVGLAGGACEGYGLLIDIRDPVNPRRVAAVADSNFSYWHSATFNNDGTKVLFSDEWGGGGGPKCRATDPKAWGANAIFTIEPGNRLVFQSYYKLPAVQTSDENCVAHNGSLIPIPGRDIMVQSWYQGGISVFDWTDPKRPTEIAFHDRGPVEVGNIGNAGSWSVYWYNGVMVSSEIGRGLDIFELTPSAHISQNEIDAAKTVRLEYLNAQGQPKFVWPPSVALARAYLDQLERSRGLGTARLAAVRQALGTSGSARTTALAQLASQLEGDAGSSSDAAKVRLLVETLRKL